MWTNYVLSYFHPVPSSAMLSVHYGVFVAMKVATAISVNNRAVGCAQTQADHIVTHGFSSQMLRMEEKIPK